MNKQALKELEKLLKERFPIGIPRKDLGHATGNVLHPRTEANRDCAGEGIPGGFKCGRQMIYPVPGVIQYLKSKMINAL